MAEKVKVYEEQTKKGMPIWAWLIPLLLVLALAIWFFNRNRHETTTAATPVTDQTKPDTGAGTQAATAWTAASIADSIRSKGRVGFGDNDDAKGASEPVSSNATDTGRAENRRVELIKQ